MATEPERVAGHVFIGVGSDQRCSLGDCGRWWTEIMDCAAAHLGKSGYAHQGDLNANELGQIETKKQREDTMYAMATAAAGRS